MAGIYDWLISKGGRQTDKKITVDNSRFNSRGKFLYNTKMCS